MVASPKMTGIRTDDFYLVSRQIDGEHDIEHRLFAKPDDIWEVNDIAAQRSGSRRSISATTRGEARRRKANRVTAGGSVRQSRHAINMPDGFALSTRGP